MEPTAYSVRYAPAFGSGGAAALGGQFLPDLQAFSASGRGPCPNSPTLFAERALGPGAAWACFIDKDEAFGLCVKRAGALIDVGVPCADSPRGEDLGAVVSRDRGDCDGIFINIQSNIKRGKLWHA